MPAFHSAGTRNLLEICLRQEKIGKSDKMEHFSKKNLQLTKPERKPTIAPHSATENKDLNQLIPYSLMILPPKHGHLKYYDYGAAFGFLIYSDDHHHKNLMWLRYY